MTIARLPFPLVRTISVFVLLFALCLVATAQAPAPAKYDSGTISGLTARNIGSATMGGRIAAGYGSQLTAPQLSGQCLTGSRRSRSAQ